MPERKTHGGKREKAGRKKEEPQMPVKMPVRLIDAARSEKARRGKGSIPKILAEWCEKGRGHQL